MAGGRVNLPLPLVRQRPWYPGQVGGIAGVDSEAGLRTSCEGTVFYVDPNHVDANDNRDGTNPTAPLATVARAIVLCSSYVGDVILVMPNDGSPYGGAVTARATPVTESVTVDKAGIRIVGTCNSGAQGVFWTPATAGGTCIIISAMDVLVEGFAFQGSTGGVGINATWTASGEGDNVTVRYCHFDDDIDTGIELEYSWYAQIYGNMFECDEYGVEALNVTGDLAYAHIYDNRFHDVGTGGTSALGLTASDRMLVERNWFYCADAVNALGAAANRMINLNTGANNMVTNNWMSCLLPVPANGDYDACNSPGTTDAWIQNMCIDGPSIRNPT